MFSRPANGEKDERCRLHHSFTVFVSMLMISAALVCCLTAIVISDDTEAESTTAGECGDDLGWTITSSGKLDIAGTGEMYDFSMSDERWGGNEVTEVDMTIGYVVYPLYPTSPIPGLNPIAFYIGTPSSIGDFAFYGCTSMTSVIIPDTVTSIGDFAFAGCSSLTSITIPDSVTSIGKNAFYGCTSLRYISIPDSVVLIDDLAFAKCSSLEKVDIVEKLNVPDTKKGEYYVESVDGQKHPVIPGCGLQGIGKLAFSDCSKLREMKLPQTLKWIYQDSIGTTSLGLLLVPSGCEIVMIQEADVQISASSTLMYEKTTYLKEEDAVLISAFIAVSGTLVALLVAVRQRRLRQ